MFEFMRNITSIFERGAETDQKADGFPTIEHYKEKIKIWKCSCGWKNSTAKKKNPSSAKKRRKRTPKKNMIRKSNLFRQKSGRRNI